MFFKNILSIDIGNHSIKIAIGKYYNNQVVIDDTVLLPTPYRAIHDGHILNLEEIKNSMSPFLKDHNLLGRKVVFSLESTSMIKRELILPSAKPKVFRKMLSYKIQEHFPTNLEQYIIQYKKIEDLYEGNVKKSRVLTAALPKKIVENYLALSKQLNVIPRCLESHASTILKLLHKNITINDQIIDNQTLLLIDLGDTTININIFDHGIYQLSRLIEIKEKNIKNSTIWIDEIVRILEFYNSRKIENKIDQIYLYGGWANEENIDQLLNDYFHIPVSKIDKINNIKINSKKYFDLSLYLNTVGGIIRN